MAEAESRERVVVTRDQGVVHVLLNRPEKKNALDAGMFAGLIDTARELAQDRSVRSVVLSGAGDSFSSGLDFSAFDAMSDGSLSGDSQALVEAEKDLSAEGAHRGQQIAWLWQELPVPVIAAVRGAAMGGGLHVALGADVRFIAPDARIGFVEVTWGLVPDLSGTQALRRLVPLDVAKKLILSGEIISGRHAVSLHLGTELSDDPLRDAMELAHRIARNSPDAVRAAKKLLNASALVPVGEGLANEFRCSTQLMGGANQIEAMMAKFEGREPRFTDPE